MRLAFFRSFSLKLPATIAMAALVAGGAVGWIGDRQASEHLRGALQGKLAALLEARRVALESVQFLMARDIRLLGQDSHLVGALSSLAGGWDATDGDVATQLRHLYLEANPHPPDERWRLEEAGDRSAYSIAHGLYHSWFHERTRNYGYRDLALIMPDGRVVYSAVKADYFATSLRHGPYSTGALARAFQQVLSRPVGGEVVFTDFHRSKAMGGIIGGVMATAVTRADGSLVGVLALTIPILPVDTVIGTRSDSGQSSRNEAGTDRPGMAETSQTYLVGSDFVMRSNARLAGQATALAYQAMTPAVEAALEGRSGVMELTAPLAGTERATALMAAFAPYDFFGVRYALIAEAPLDEVLAPVDRMRRDALLGGIAAMAVVALGGMALAQGIVGPLSGLARTMLRLADGDLEATVTGDRRHDEIGALARAVQLFKDNLVAVGRLQAERERDLARLEEASRLITASIAYAGRIQGSLLRTEHQLAARLQDCLLVWRPRDIVGGDFYWFHEWPGHDGFVAIVADCTGHGVPGALMTMLTGALLDRALEMAEPDPAAILQTWNRLIKGALGQDRGHALVDDGVEAGVCCVDRSAGQLSFAGARFSLWSVCDGVVREIKGERRGIGFHATPRDLDFTGHVVPLQPGATFFMATDGIIDQIGGASRIAFGKRRFSALLERYAGLPLAEQKPLILRDLDEYRGRESWRDDITLFGFRV